MSTATATATLPEIQASAPAPQKQPAKAPPETKQSSPPSEVKTVAKDWQPKSLEDSIALAMGEVRREGEAPKEEKQPDDGKAKEPVAKKPLADDITDDELESHIAEETKGMEEPARKSWSELRKAERAMKRELSDLKAKLAETESVKAKLAELEKNGKPTPEMEARMKELQEKFETADNEVAAIRVEKSVAYQERVGKPIAAIEKFGTDLATRYSLDAEELIAALRDTSAERGEKLSDIAAEMKEFDRGEFFQAARDYAVFAGQRETIMQSAKTWLEGVESEQKKAAEATSGKVTEEWKQAVPEKWDSVTKESGIAPIDGDADFNARFDVAKKFAHETHFADLAVPSQVEALHRAAVFPFVIGAIKTKDARIAELEAELSKYEEAKPSIGGSPRSSSASSASTGASKLTFEQAVEKAINEAGGA